VNETYARARPEDALTFVLSQYGRPFGGKSPGGGWKALDVTAINNHVEDDPDARTKPPTFIPLARNTHQDLFGIRVVGSKLIPSHWNRNRRALTDVSDLIAFDHIFTPGVLVGFRDAMIARYRSVFRGTVSDARPPFGIRALFLEPLCMGNIDAAVIDYARQSFDALSVADPRIVACFGADMQSAWDWRAWLAASRLLLTEISGNSDDVEVAVTAFENAVYAVMVRPTRFYWPAEAVTVRFAIETEIWPMLREMESVPELKPVVTVSAGMLAAYLSFMDNKVARMLKANRIKFKTMPTIAEAYELAMAECLREEDPRKYAILRRYGLPLRLSEE